MSARMLINSAKPAFTARSGAMPVMAAILAAGLSRRMGSINKLVQEIDNMPMVRRVAEQLLESRCKRVVAVVGHEAAAVRRSLDGLALQFVENTEYKEGLAASVRAAARSCLPGEALLICLGDMPQVPTSVINQLLQAYHRSQDSQSRRGSSSTPAASSRQTGSRGEFSDMAEEGGLSGRIAAFQPEHKGRRGNPVLWTPQAVPLLMQLTGDKGARALLQHLGDAVVAVPVNTPGIFMDIDTPEALNAARRPPARSAGEQ